MDNYALHNIEPNVPIADKYLTLFNNIAQGFCIVELLFDTAGKPYDYRFLEVNPAFEKQTGIENALGKTMRQLQPDMEEYWYELFGNAVKTGQPVHFERQAENLAGGVWYEVFAYPFGNQQLAILFNDITLRKRLQDRQAFLLKLNDALRPLADPLEIQAVAAKLLGQHLDVNQSHYGEVSGRHHHEELRQSDDVTTDPAISQTERAALAAAQIGAYIAVPLVKKEEWVATLSIHSIAPRNWKQHEIELVEETAERIWAAVERAKAQDALRKSEEALRESESLLYGQKEAFQAAMSGQSLAVSLGVLFRTAIQQTAGEARAAFFMIPPQGKDLYLVAGMSEEYARDVNGFAVGPESMAFGLAVHSGNAVITPDVEKEPLWKPWLWLARKHNYRACWSFPVRTEGGPALGTFAMYYQNPRQPNARDLELAALVSHAAAIIMSRHTELVERTQAEEALRKSEALLTTVFKVSPIGIGFTDLNGKILLSNDEMLRFQNHPGIRAAHGKPVTPLMEMIFTDDDNNKIWTRVASIAVRNDRDEVIGNVSVVTDIDELKRIAEALQESERQLKQLIKLKDEFIGIASHELKTPVTSMKAYAEIVHERLEETGDHENSDLLMRLTAQIDRLTTLINHLLDTARIAEGQLQLIVESIDVNELLLERIEEIKRTTNHRFVWQPQELPPVVADRERIGQVITNLLSNAIKYSPKGSDITINSQAVQNGIEISVQDRGYGIPVSDQQKIFDRFFRVTANKMDTYPGMGLGLYITSQIIQKHNGAISVKSEPGKGSVFTFFLPYTNNQPK